LKRAIYESTFQNLNYYNVNYVGLDYRHYFNKKLLASAFGYYQINLYPSSATVGGVNDKRYDQFFGGGAEIRYDIRKWISVKARYDYKQRKSRFGTFNYIDNLVTLTGTIGF